MKLALRIGAVMLAIAVGRTESASGDSHWGYGKDNGPSQWGGVCNAADSRRQSPIDIDLSTVVGTCALGALRWKGADADVGSIYAQNNGHTAFFVPLDANGALHEVYMSAGGLPGVYELLGFHFHWAQVSSDGSEHTVGGLHYPAELHFVHKRVGDGPDNELLAVLGVLIHARDGVDDHEGFAPVQKMLASITVAGKNRTFAPSELDGALVLSNLLPKGKHVLDQYYRYMGSLTTPPCNETVVWTVLTKPLVISTAQMEALRAIENDKGELFANNRPYAPVNDCTVSLALGDCSLSAGGDRPPPPRAAALLLAAVAVSIVALMPH